MDCAVSTSLSVSQIVVVSGFAAAFVVGALSQRSNFCTLGALSDIVNMGDWGRMRMWLLAIAVSILGAQALHAAGLIDLGKAFYVRSNLTWLSALVGGLCFGIGMTLASGCGSKTLLRMGSGNAKSFIVFVFLAISGYMTMRGLFAVWRTETLDLAVFDLTSRGIAGQDVPTLLNAAFGLDRKTAALVVSGVLVLGLLIFVFKDADFRRNVDGILAGTAWGLAVTAGWYVTGHVGFAENPDTLEMTYLGTNSKTLESMTFVAPYSYTLELLMLWSDKSLKVTFGIASVLGLFAGALAYSLASKSWRPEGFTQVSDLRNHVIGGVLMGFGGVTAMGCTVGQGITGVSTLALGSFIALAGIIIGCVATLKFQFWLMMREA